MVYSIRSETQHYLNSFLMSYKSFILIISVLFLSFGKKTSDFKTEQLKHSRVQIAYQDYECLVQKVLKNHSIEKLNIFIRGFKAEEQLEIWGKNESDLHYKLLKSYKICWSAGDLGPKRKQGDYQVPEGFYNINVFNPKSNFYLSLGIDYPNASDRILGYRQNLGGDIYIHGACVTVGCIPITNEPIKELYVFAVEAKNNRHAQIPVHLFPSRLTDTFINNYKYEDYMDYNHTKFWKNLKKGYDYFETHKTLPIISVSETGAYVFREK